MKSYPLMFQPSIPPPPAPVSLEAWVVLAIAVICFTVSVSLLLWVGRRNFYRNNAAGIQEFKNFRSAVLSSIVEGLAQFVADSAGDPTKRAILGSLLLFFPSR